MWPTGHRELPSAAEYTSAVGVSDRSFSLSGFEARGVRKVNHVWIALARSKAVASPWELHGRHCRIAGTSFEPAATKPSWKRAGGWG
jgi:hypothetical protein